jgi:hypothetical protein
MHFDLWVDCIAFIELLNQHCSSLSFRKRLRGVVIVAPVRFFFPDECFSGLPFAHHASFQGDPAHCDSGRWNRFRARDDSVSVLGEVLKTATPQNSVLVGKRVISFSAWDFELPLNRRPSTEIWC